MLLSIVTSAEQEREPFDAMFTHITLRNFAAPEGSKLGRADLSGLWDDFSTSFLP